WQLEQGAGQDWAKSATWFARGTKLTLRPLLSTGSRIQSISRSAASSPFTFFSRALAKAVRFLRRHLLAHHRFGSGYVTKCCESCIGVLQGNSDRWSHILKGNFSKLQSCVVPKNLCSR